MLTAAHYLQSTGRPASLVDLGDIVKAGTLDIHRAWTCDIRSGKTSEIEIQELIKSKGTHIESKNSNDDILLKSEGTGLPATDDLASKVQLLQKQLAALTATGMQGGGRGFYKGRGRGRGGTGGRGFDTRTCYGCGKRGHIRRYCPDEKNVDKDEDTVTPAVGFPTIVVDSPTYFRDESIIMTSPPPVCQQSFQLLGWTWDSLRKEYFDPRTSPNIVEFKIDPLT